jgi:hypothetical protein
VFVLQPQLGPWTSSLCLCTCLKHTEPNEVPDPSALIIAAILLIARTCFLALQGQSGGHSDSRGKGLLLREQKKSAKGSHAQLVYCGTLLLACGLEPQDFLSTTRTFFVEFTTQGNARLTLAHCIYIPRNGTRSGLNQDMS